VRRLSRNYDNQSHPMVFGLTNIVLIVNGEYKIYTKTLAPDKLFRPCHLIKLLLATSQTNL
ncbi:MAG TPA: hypothetical protein VFP97_02280, partial [Chitinophagaceae bacterium]|nr:hypothetical protein [Chitinophagaceae bacterium]